MPTSDTLLRTSSWRIGAMQRGAPVRASSSVPVHMWRAHRRSSPRHFSSSTRCRQQQEFKESFGTRLRRALGQTKIKWYPIPVSLGIASVGALHLYRVNEREKARRQEEEEDDDGTVNFAGRDSEGRPKRRQRIRPDGPWYVD
jgi:phosphatidylserine decarboxylase